MPVRGLYLCRLAFSTLGDQLAVVNSSDPEGNMAAVSTCPRERWSEGQLQLIGHESIVTCASFCPRLFEDKEETAVVRACVLAASLQAAQAHDVLRSQCSCACMQKTACCLDGGSAIHHGRVRFPMHTHDSSGCLRMQQWLALGSNDKAISLWPQGDAKPRLVLRKAFRAGVPDLAWAPDGSMLVAVSQDGTAITVCFEPGELGTLMEQSKARAARPAAS
jgi:hypothetical protein